MAKAKRVQSWGDIPQEKFEAFYAAVEALREEMIPRDCDGDSPISYQICNKMTHRPGGDPVPQNRIYSYETHGYLELHPDKQQELDDEMEQALSFNVHTAASALDQYMRIKQHQHYEDRQRRRPLDVQVKEECAHCKKKVGFNPNDKRDGYKDTRKAYPGYPANYHSNGEECDAFILWRTAFWELNHPNEKDEKRYCPNPDCRALLRNEESRKGKNDQDVCLNNRCPNSKPKEVSK